MARNPPSDPRSPRPLILIFLPFYGPPSCAGGREADWRAPGAQVLPLPDLLAGLGRPLPGLGPGGLSQGPHRQAGDVTQLTSQSESFLRFMSSIWALFAVVFLAIYTANLAAFMIPRKEYHDLTGLDDPKISNPYSEQPALKYTTIPYSYSHVSHSSLS